ncbi:MAG: TonB-dependent receptor [Pseudoxanthomonas sp.]
MNKNRRRATQIRLARSTLALALALAGSSAFAQSTTGGISGVAPPGAATVLVENDSGFRREVPVDANGRYSLGNLPLGTYKVTAKSGDTVVGTRENISIRVGATSDASFGEATTLGTVSVTGSRVTPIDVTQVDTRTVVTSEQLQQLPLGRTAEAIALLAPGVVVNSGGYDNGPLGGSLASFGGSAASENAYYLNGFNTTNSATSLGGLTLPYGAIDQQEIFTGGYGAQYGRSNGGVINQVGKRGSNEWHFGAAVTWEPNSLKASQKDLYWRADSLTSSASNAAYTYAKAANGLYQPLSETESSATTYSAYVGGPIIKDRLFFFVAAEKVDSDGIRIVPNRDSGNGSSGGLTDYEYEQKRWYAKVDWNITDNHLLELTGASDVAETSGVIYKYDYVNRERGDFYSNESAQKTGPTLYSAKYTGYFGDNVTVTALYGQMTTPDEVTPYNYDAANGPVIGGISLQNPAYTGGTPIAGSQTVSSLTSPDREYKKENLRLNLEWKLGAHTLSFGVDNQKAEGNDLGSYSSGPGYSWTYGQTDDPYGLESDGLISEAANANGGVGAPSPALVDPVYGAEGYYVTKDVSYALYSNRAEQDAYYIEDKWQVTDNLLLNLGLRGDKFANYRPNSSEAFVDTDLLLAPRLGFSWDVNGDSSLKVFGNIGRYYLGLPTNSFAGLLAGGAVVSTTTYYTYSGINADGTPIIATQLGYPVSANSQFGLAGQAIETSSAKDLKGENQDEIILGFTKQLESGWVYGVRATHRRLNVGIDDINVDLGNTGLVNAAIAAGLESQELDGETWYWDPTKTYGSAAINPGETNVYRVVGWDGAVHELTVTREQQGFPEFKRRYSAVEFNLERPFDGKWYAKFNYVWSHSYGTTEGQLRSDLWRTGGALGSYQGQAAVSTTQSWDHAALMENFNGDQSNDHRHQVKLYGYYQLTPEWGVSGNLSLISGAPKNCLGAYAGDNYDSADPAGYGSSVTGYPYHFCNGEPSPPGSQGRLGWINTLDFGLTYKPNFADGKLAFNLNVFNITNEQTATNVYPFSELTDGTTHPLYGQPVAYQTPRYARLTVSYDY